MDRSPSQVSKKAARYLHVRPLSVFTVGSHSIQITLSDKNATSRNPTATIMLKASVNPERSPVVAGITLRARTTDDSCKRAEHLLSRMLKRLYSSSWPMSFTDPLSGRRIRGTQRHGLPPGCRNVILDSWLPASSLPASPCTARFEPGTPGPASMPGPGWGEPPRSRGRGFARSL